MPAPANFTDAQARATFDAMIATATAAGERNLADQVRLAREYFLNPEFREALRDQVWNTLNPPAAR